MKNKKKPSKNPIGNVHPTRIFQTPEDMEKEWNNYKKWVEDVQSKEWTKIQYVGKDGTRKSDKYKVPISEDGFLVYCKNVAKLGIVEQYFKNTNGYYADFIPLCKEIKREIRSQHIIGGMLGVYNSSVTQRLHGLTEKTENKHDVEVKTITGMVINKE